MVGPVDVLEGEDQRALERDRLDRRAHGGEEGLPRTLRVLFDRAPLRRRADPQQAGDHRRLALRGLAARLVGRVAVAQQLAQAPGELAPGELGVVAVGDLRLGAQDLGERPVHHARPVGQAAALVHRGSELLRVQAPGELAPQPRLAHARLADHRRQVGPGLAHDATVGRDQELELVLPSHQRGLAPGDASPGRLGGQQADGLPGRDRLGLALEVERADLAVVDRVAGGAIGALADGHRLGATGGLQARGHVDGVAGDRVGVAHRAGQDLAGVHAHPQREVDVVLRARLGVDLLHRLLHAQGGADRALGVVLVGHRRAEQGHDVVADVLVDGAAVALDLLAQAPQEALDHRLEGLGVEALGHRGVAGEVGEEDGDLAALLGGAAGRRGGWGGRRGRGAGQRGSAGHAEPRLGGRRLAAAGAAALQGGAARHAEARTLGIRRRAGRAHHPGHGSDHSARARR